MRDVTADFHMTSSSDCYDFNGEIKIRANNKDDYEVIKNFIMDFINHKKHDLRKEEAIKEIIKNPF